jgi:hypothetical protein
VVSFHLDDLQIGGRRALLRGLEAAGQRGEAGELRNMKTALIFTLTTGSLVALGVIGCAAPVQTQNQARSTTLLSAAIAAPAPSGDQNANPKAGDPATSAPKDAADQSEAFPTACAGEQTLKDTKACLPPSSFSKKMCSGVYPEVALSMFSKGTPWTRVFLSGDVEAWNASGGLTSRTKLAFDEEVIVLQRHGAASMGGIVMTGAQASFDVLRWDGSCVSIMEGELTTRTPPKPKPAAVPWSRLDESTRRALLYSPKVKSTHDSLDKACTPSAGVPVSKKSCDKADKAFTLAVVDYVRSGNASLPTPARRPQ